MNYCRIVVVFVLALAGCDTGTMVQDKFDPKTGVTTRTIYSKYYDAGDWILSHHLGMSVVVDQDNSAVEVPGVYGVQSSIGALGPSDAVAKGKVTVYIWNRDKEPHRGKIVRVSTPESTLDPHGITFVGVEGKRIGGEIGYVQIGHYGTQIGMKIEYLIDDAPAVLNLVLLRRTDEELIQYFGPGGIAPYPWFHDSTKTN
jgi:hypothetical protein